MDPAIQAIRQRAADLERRLADWEIAGKAMLAERDELRAALRVYERFADEDVSTELSEPDFEARMLVEAPEMPATERPGRSATTKPDGVPTVPDMIFEALAAADMVGEPGLLPKEILAYIRQKYWSDAPSDSVGPVVWRMWKKEKRLDKVGELYALKSDPSGELFHSRANADEPQEAVSM